MDTSLSPSMGMHTGLSQPRDPDAIKLFVGQIPKGWNEPEVREILQAFGPIHELTILRDRVTGLHKGCAFVTFCERQAAVDAQQALHEKKTLPGMHHPMQVKPATNEHKNNTPAAERRLFVGMLSKELTEEDVKIVFSPYGIVEDVSILRNADGTSKGAAFVRMSTKSEALQSITALHQSQTMHGCSAPLVVKIADTDKEKMAKRQMQAVVNLGAGINTLGLNAAFGLGTLGAAAYYQQLLQLQSGVATANNSFGLGTGLGNSEPSDALGLDCDPPCSLDLALTALTQGSSTATAYTPARTTGLGNLGSAALGAAAASAMTNHKGLGTTNDTIMQAYMQHLYPATAESHPTSRLLNPTSAFATHATSGGQLMQASPVSVGTSSSYLQLKQKEAQSPCTGPEGSNLFIYHLPNDVQDSDLIQMFAPFGSVISAKVFIDKVTNLSKCFGFVSYDNPVSAQNAIQAMNGFQLGTKRLKVQLKRPKDANKPY